LHFFVFYGALTTGVKDNILQCATFYCFRSKLSAPVCPCDNAAFIVYMIIDVMFDVKFSQQAVTK